jgi:DNA-binding phage protein
MRVTLWPKHLGLKSLVHKGWSLLRATKSVTLFSGGLNHAVSKGIEPNDSGDATVGRTTPTLKTLLAVLKTVGLRLSVEPEHPIHAWWRQ